MKNYVLQAMVYNRKDVVVTRNGRGPGRVTYSGKFAGVVKLGKGGVPEFRPVRWVDKWEQGRLLRERAIHLYEQQLTHYNKAVRREKVTNGRRQRRHRSYRAKSSQQYATS